MFIAILITKCINLMVNGSITQILSISKSTYLIRIHLQLLFHNIVLRILQKKEVIINQQELLGKQEQWLHPELFLLCIILLLLQEVDMIVTIIRIMDMQQKVKFFFQEVELVRDLKQEWKCLLNLIKISSHLLKMM